MSTRRQFLQQASAATALGMAVPMPDRRIWSMTPAELTPEPDEALLRQVAQTAVDEARRAGATFADVRLAWTRYVTFVPAQYRHGKMLRRKWPMVRAPKSIGVRALVDGAWGFATAQMITQDAAAETARIAVAGARANKPRHRSALDLAPVESTPNGFWEMRIEQDPFAIPLREQRDAAEAALSQLTSIPEALEGEIGVEWQRHATVFASTDGTVVLQRLALAKPGGSVEVKGRRYPNSQAESGFKCIRVGPYGYEALGVEQLKESVREATEQAIALADAVATATSVDVGRYDLVFAPAAVGALLVATVAEALNLPRALGYHANGDGTSFAAPPGEVLGKLQVGSPLLTVHGDRTQPGGAATVAWDEEGVKPDAYAFIKDGVVVDYHTSRQTAMEIGGWYRSRGEPVRSHGTMRRTGHVRPNVAVPNLTMDPGTSATTVDDLIAGTKRGFYVEAAGGRSDQQLLNTQFSAMPRKIVNGKLGGYVKDLAFQFITQPFWKSIDGIGGAASSRARPMVTDELAEYSIDQPFPFSTVRTVPIRARAVNVLNIGRTA